MTIIYIYHDVAATTVRNAAGSLTVTMPWRFLISSRLSPNNRRVLQLVPSFFNCFELPCIMTTMKVIGDYEKIPNG